MIIHEPDKASQLTTMLVQLSRHAISGNQKIIKTLTEVLSQVPDLAESGEQGLCITRYLEFLKELTLAKNRKAFFTTADPEMMNILRQLLEQKPVNDESGLNSVAQELQQLTQQAMAGDPGINTEIDALLEQLGEENETDDEDRFIRQYLEFLKELAKAPDKKAFLIEANEDILGVMQQLS